MTDVYVGLIATRRTLQGDEVKRYRDQLIANASGSAATIAAIGAAEYFYTFHYAYFSSNQAFGYEPEDPTNRYQTNPNLAEPATKRARKHYEDARPCRMRNGCRGTHYALLVPSARMPTAWPYAARRLPRAPLSSRLTAIAQCGHVKVWSPPKCVCHRPHEGLGHVRDVPGTPVSSITCRPTYRAVAERRRTLNW